MVTGMTRTVLIKAPTLDTAARSALLDMIEDDMAGGVAHTRDEIHAAHVASECPLRLLAWDACNTGPSQGFPMTDEEIDALVRGL